MWGFWVAGGIEAGVGGGTGLGFGIRSRRLRLSRCRGLRRRGRREVFLLARWWRQWQSQSIHEKKPGVNVRSKAGC